MLVHVDRVGRSFEVLSMWMGGFTHWISVGVGVMGSLAKVVDR